MEILFIGKYKHNNSSIAYPLLSNYDPGSIVLDHVYKDCAMSILTFTSDDHIAREHRSVRCIFTSKRCFIRNDGVLSDARTRCIPKADCSGEYNLFFAMSDGTHVYCKIINEDMAGLEINWLNNEDAVYTFLLD